MDDDPMEVDEPNFIRITDGNNLELGKLYIIYDNDDPRVNRYSNYEFIATIIPQPSGEIIIPDTGEIRFQILYKRRVSDQALMPNPWVDIHDNLDIIYNGDDLEEVDSILGSRTRIALNAANLSESQYVLDLEIRIPQPVYNIVTGQVENRTLISPQEINDLVANLAAMDTTSGGKRRKTRRRTKRSRKSRKGKMFYGGEKINFQNGNKYDGDIDENRMPHGQGTMTFSNGNRYEGNWENGERSGQGIMRWPVRVGETSGDVYEGDWEEGNQNGHGTMRYGNGDVYEGNWREGEMNGQGTMTYSNGNVWVGRWDHGDKIGRGMKGGNRTKKGRSLKRKCGSLRHRK